MCGRYALYSGKELIEKVFKAPFKQDFYTPNYNIPPGTTNPVVLLGKAREAGISGLRWGLVPSFAKDDKIGFNMINARSETIDEKPSFQKPFQRKRCLIPANGFYEWKKIEGTDTKIPFFIRLMEDEIFAFAGLFDSWQQPNGEMLFTYTIITTTANDLLQPIHERMPVILDSDQYDNWLNPLNDDYESLIGMLKPYPTEKMRAYRIKPDVNKTSNNSPDLINPVV